MLKKKDEMLSIWTKETRRMRYGLKKLEKVLHKAIHEAFIILGDLVGIYKANEVNVYVLKGTLVCLKLRITQR